MACDVNDPIKISRTSLMMFNSSCDCIDLLKSQEGYANNGISNINEHSFTDSLFKT